MPFREPQDVLVRAEGSWPLDPFLRKISGIKLVYVSGETIEMIRQTVLQAVLTVLTVLQ